MINLRWFWLPPNFFFTTTPNFVSISHFYAYYYFDIFRTFSSPSFHFRPPTVSPFRLSSYVNWTNISVLWLPTLRSLFLPEVLLYSYFFQVGAFVPECNLKWSYISKTFSVRFARSSIHFLNIFSGGDNFFLSLHNGHRLIHFAVSNEIKNYQIII